MDGLKTLLATSGLIALHAIAFCGWGRVFARVSGIGSLSLPLSTASGLALVIGFGGVLNALGWVSSVALWILLGMGLMGFGLSSRPRDSLRVSGSTLIACVLAVLVLLWVLATLVPALQFNYHDDFQKY